MRVATCARDALDLVLVTFEVAADGDERAGEGFAPALLQALHGVKAMSSLQLDLPELPLEEDVAREEMKKSKVHVANAH